MNTYIIILTAAFILGLIWGAGLMSLRIGPQSDKRIHQLREKE